MNVLIVSTSERTGGAAIAASRLMHALNNNGIKARMLVRSRQTENVSVISLGRPLRQKLCFVWERLVILFSNRLHRHRLFEADLANAGSDIRNLPEFREADIIHLHWINQGFLSLEDIKAIADTGKPVVWTLHDMWPFTGICHYSGDCDRYMASCHDCHLLYGGGSSRDISYRVQERKKKLIPDSIAFVTCSQWLGNLARKSSLCCNRRVLSIPNALSTNVFHPMDKAESRRRLGLPEDKRLLLFGSLKITDRRKGVEYLVRASEILSASSPALSRDLAIVTMGHAGDRIKSSFPFPVYDLDYVSSEQDLAGVYSASDVFVIPSLEDNLPNTIAEAMACGVPCVGFATGGIPEMIDHLENGYVAGRCSADDLARGIRWILEETDYGAASSLAVKKARTAYSESSVALRYAEVYSKLLGE